MDRRCGASARPCSAAADCCGSEGILKQVDARLLRKPMSAKHPIISVTGSSGAGTTSVRQTFETIFRREHITAAFIEGDAFHRYDRAEMERAMAEAKKRGNSQFSHFGLEANLLEELEDVFADLRRERHGAHAPLRPRRARGGAARRAGRRVHAVGGFPARHRPLVLRGPARGVGDGEGQRRAACRSQDRRRARDQSRMDPEDHARQVDARLLARKR